MNESLYLYLCSFLHDRKKEIFDHVASNRTRHIAVVMEDLHRSQNSSAILRTAESCGFQDVYTIENHHPFMVRQRIAKGAAQWLSIHRFNGNTDNTVHCFEALKKKNYRIVVADVHSANLELAEMDVTEKTAIVFGAELRGISEQARTMADASISIPMHGFTESLNVSNAAAILLFRIREMLENKAVNWKISVEEQLDLKTAWAKSSIQMSKQLIQFFENENTSSAP